MQAAQTADLCDVSFTNRRNDRLMMIDLHQAVLHVRIFGYLDQEYLLIQCKLLVKQMRIAGNAGNLQMEVNILLNAAIHIAVTGRRFAIFCQCGQTFKIGGTAIVSRQLHRQYILRQAQRTDLLDFRIGKLDHGYRSYQ